jgi:putative hemolysin
VSNLSIDHELLLIILFLLLSAFFSGSEAAFFSLSKIQRKKLEKSPRASERRVYRLLERPRKLLATILFGNTLVNITISSLTAVLALHMSTRLPPALNLTIQVIVVTGAILIFGEILPKIVAYSRATAFAALSGPILQVLSWVFYPIVKTLEWITLLISRRDPAQTREENLITSEDFRNLIDSRAAEHPLQESEQRIIKSIFRLRSTEVKEIMAPRVDMVAVDIDQGWENLKSRIVESGHSRIPIYRKNIDNIIGFVYAKDLILKHDIQAIGSLLRKPAFVTENMNIQNLLNHFRSTKVHLAIVVDEYGGTSGLITLEDVLEELFGEIVDEHDHEAPRLIQITEDEFIVSGMVSATELNQEYHLGIDDNTYENLASFLYDEFNHVPAAGESVRFENRVLFTVTEVDGARIEYVRVKLLPPDEEGE